MSSLISFWNNTLNVYNIETMVTLTKQCDQVNKSKPVHSTCPEEIEILYKIQVHIFQIVIQCTCIVIVSQAITLRVQVCDISNIKCLLIFLCHFIKCKLAHTIVNTFIVFEEDNCNLSKSVVYL